MSLLNIIVEKKLAMWPKIVLLKIRHDVIILQIISCIFSFTDLKIQVEFLIRAHDCYTLGCSVGGIADLLVTAQNTTSKLVAGKHFKVMVSVAYLHIIY